MIQFSCHQCGTIVSRAAGHVNRARARGNNLYCGRKCSGLARQTHKTKAQKVSEKRTYDLAYRSKNLAAIKTKKAAHHRATYDPALARIERKKRAAFHAEYCRRPSYKLWKQEYDRRYRAQEYGSFAEAYTLTLELNREIKSRSSNYEIRRANQTGNKAQERDRASQETRNDSHSAAHG